MKVSTDRSIDPALLFQRFLVVSQMRNLWLDDVMSYELSIPDVFVWGEKASCVRRTNCNLPKQSNLLKQNQWCAANCSSHRAQRTRWRVSSSPSEMEGGEHLQLDCRRLCHCWKLWKSDCGVWWLWGWTVQIRGEVECKQGEHYRGGNIFWGKGRLLVEWSKQAGTDPADHGTNEAKRMWCYSSWRRCWCWDCKGSHQYVCFQTDKPYWRRHRSSSSLAVSYRCFQMYCTLFLLWQGEILCL